MNWMPSIKKENNKVIEKITEATKYSCTIALAVTKWMWHHRSVKNAFGTLQPCPYIWSAEVKLVKYPVEHSYMYIWLAINIFTHCYCPVSMSSRRPIYFIKCSTSHATYPKWIDWKKLREFVYEIWLVRLHYEFTRRQHVDSVHSRHSLLRFLFIYNIKHPFCSNAHV